jgi:hypothetical protein
MSICAHLTPFSTNRWKNCAAVIEPRQQRLVLGDDQQSRVLGEQFLGEAGDHLLERKLAELVEIDLHGLVA